MTFNELAQSLPQGFHDAEFQRFEMDYLSRRLVFDVVIWIGDMDNEQAREMYRPARVTVEDVAYLVIEPPDPSYTWKEPGHLIIDTGAGQPANSETPLPEAPHGTSVTFMYVYNFNRFMYFAASHASLEWTGPEEDHA